VAAVPIASHNPELKKKVRVTNIAAATTTTTTITTANNNNT
jgi:hypothetical protein